MKSVPLKFQPLARVAAIAIVALLTVTLLAAPQSTPTAQAQTGNSPTQSSGSGVCGGSIALVFDLSGHVSQTELTATKNAARTFVQNLAGTPHQIALFNYAAGAPAHQAGTVPLTSVGDQTGVQRVLNGINVLTKPSTDPRLDSNWEGGFRVVRDAMNAGTHFDHVFFMAGGPSTRDDSGTNTTLRGFSTERADLDSAQAMRNQVAGADTEVIPVGVGDGIVNNHVPVYRGGFLDLIPSREWADVLLRNLATTSARTIIVTEAQIGNLPRLMAERAVSTCVQVNKQIVDGDGNRAEPGVGWTVDANVSGGPPGASLGSNTLTTGAQGQAQTVINGLTSGTAAVTLTEQQRETHSIYPVNGRAATCTIQRPGQREPITVQPQAAGEHGVTIDVQARDTVTCTFSNRPQVPLRLTKTVNADAQSAMDEIADIPYSFNYVCTDGGRTVAEGTVEAVRPDMTVTLERVPVGTVCTFIEQEPAHDHGRHQLRTTWNVAGGTPVETSADGFTHRFRVAMPAPGSGGAGVTVGVENFYSALTGTLTLRKNIPEGNLPEERIPEVIPVRYFCRYVPDPDARPELDGGVNNPGYVSSGNVEIPRGGEATIGPFPVGTQCGFEETAEVPGYSFNASWGSDACLDYREQGGSGIRECRANYVRIPQAGDYAVEVTNTYERQTAVLEINKQVSGDAAPRGEERSYVFDVVCVDGETEVFSRDGISVTPGLPGRVTGVPVASDCTVTETAPAVPGVDVISHVDPSTVRIEEAGDTYPVTVTNALTYRRGEVRLNNIIQIEDISDSEILTELSTAVIDVQARCWEPGATTAIERSVSVSDGEAASFGTFPVGTSCILTETYSPPSGVAHHPSFSPTSVVVDSAGGVTVDLFNHFTPAELGLMIHNDVGTTAPIPDADLLIPGSFTFNLQCNGDSGTVSLADGEMAVIEGIAAGSECVITGTVDDNEALERTTSWNGTDAMGTVTGESSGGIFSFTVAIPWDDSEGVAVDVLHTYAPVLQPVSVSKDITVQYPDGSAVPREIRDAVIPRGQGLLMSYVCTRNGQEIDRASRVMVPGETRQAMLPVNADCVFTSGEQQLTSAEGPETVWSGTGTLLDGAYRVTPTALSLDFVDVENIYVLKTGGFNLKKKVDGEGVATIPADREYLVGYVCRLNDVTVDEGVFQIGRFDDGQEHQVTGIPVGSECAVQEDPETSGEENAQWTSRWTLADGPTGWETERTCASVANCRPSPGDGQHYQVFFTITDQGEVAPEQHFQGTLVVWNTYTYDKVNLNVSKQLAGDGPVLAANDEFVFLYTCTDPGYEGSELEDLPYVPDPTITGTLRVTGEGEAVETIRDPENPEGTTTTASKEIPVGYDCVITENPVPGYDAVVTTSFNGAGIREGENTDPTQTWVTATFSTSPEFAGTAQPVTVINTYDRPRANLLVSKTYDTGVEGTVHEYLDNPGAPYLMDWVCEDRVRDVIYQGTVAVPSGGDDVPVIRTDVPEGVDPRLPAATTCSLTERADDRVPDGFEDLVETSTQVQWLEAEAGGNYTQRVQGSGMSMEGVALLAEGTTRMAFTNSYYVPQVELVVGKVVEGDDEGEVFPPATDATEQYRFGFSYRCEFPLLPGQPAPFEPNGTFELARGESWGQEVPVGTTCDVTEEAPSEQVQQRLDEFELNYQPNYAYPGTADSNGELARAPLGAEDRFTLTTQIGPGGVVETGNNAVVFNSLFRGDGEVIVQKINPDGEPLPGARFAIHPASAPGEMDPEPVVENMAPFPDGEPGTQFTARLVPGTYYLVETQSGTGSQLMPQPWHFTVRPVSEEGELGDLRFELSDYSSNSGLIEVEHSDPGDATSPWIIRVANIAAGELPLSGGRGIWPGILVGLALVLAGLIWFWRRSSRR